jgi:hypothetical protein
LGEDGGDNSVSASVSVPLALEVDAAEDTSQIGDSARCRSEGSWMRDPLRERGRRTRLQSVSASSE